MRMRRTVAPDPAQLLVSTADLRAHLNLLDASHDAQIAAMAAAAVEHLDGKDGILGRSLVTQSWDLLMDAFPDGAFKIPLPPLQSVTSITYIDPNGAEQTLSTDVFAVDAVSEPGVVSLKKGQSWPATLAQRNAVTVSFVAGYGDPTAVPDRLKSAIKLIVGDMYENREAAIVGVSRTDNPTVARLIFPLRIF